MRPGKVIGSVTLSTGARQFRGARWLLVAPLGAEQLGGSGAGFKRGTWTPVVYDRLGAGVGDTIFYVEGSEATQPFDEPIPLDAISIAIIDHIDFQTPATKKN